jgi:hypothetical protein
MLHGSEEVSAIGMSQTVASSRQVPLAQGRYCISQDHFQRCEFGSDPRFRAVLI